MEEPTIMTFTPTWKEFQDFPKYIDYMESQGAHLAGLAKIIPPAEWVPRKKGYNIRGIDMPISSPIMQSMVGKCGQYQQLNITKPTMTLVQFRELAESDRYRAPNTQSNEDLERLYWRTLPFVSPYYGADSAGSLCDDHLTTWNINRLGSILDLVEEDYGVKIDGVNTAYLYFGMWKATFAWHTEDVDLYSINYIHFGKPKQWYAIPPSQGRRFEQVAMSLFPECHKSCPAFLRHKMTVISPQILKRHQVTVNSIVQKEREIMITFPYSYHAGFNHGFNAAEATNFATPRWVEYGKRASKCSCSNDAVRISMRTFVKHFQPDRYELWLKGRDIGAHPEDPAKKVCPAPLPPIEYGENAPKVERTTRASKPKAKPLNKKIKSARFQPKANDENARPLKGRKVLERAKPRNASKKRLQVTAEIISERRASKRVRRLPLKLRL